MKKYESVELEITEVSRIDTIQVSNNEDDWFADV